MDFRRLCWIVLVALGSTGRADATQPPPGFTAQPESTPPIAQRIAELGHRDLAVRWYAAYALGQRASDARDAVGPLRKRLDAVDEHEYVRAEAAWALGRIGTSAAPAIPSLVATLESQLPAVRQHAALALGRIGPPARASAPALERLLSDASPAVRAAAAASLWRMVRRDRAIALLCEMATSSDDAASYTAVVTMGELDADDDRVPAALGAAMAHRDADIRRAAAASLGTIGQAAVGPLTAATTSRSPTCRALAAETLAGLGATHLPRVAAMLDDPDPQVRAAAGRALGRLGAKAQPALARLLRAVEDRDATVRTAAAEALRQVRGK